MLRLPNETLLQITSFLHEDPRNPDPQRSLRNLSLACKRLLPIAQEALSEAPTLHSYKVGKILEFLAKYPNLRTKVKRLTIETKEIRRPNVPLKRMSRMSRSTTASYIREIRSFPISASTRSSWERAMNSPNNPTHGAYLCLLLSILPHLSELYLGGSALFNFPLFSDLLSENYTCKTILVRHHQTPNLHITTSTFSLPGLLSLIGPRLKVLELPNAFVLSNRPGARSSYIRSKQIPSLFPNLHRLMINADSLRGNYPENIIPRHVQQLVLTNGNDLQYLQRWVAHAAQRKAGFFPDLAKVTVYMAFDVPRVLRYAVQIAGAGIECRWIIPGEVVRPSDVFSHPWWYGEEEYSAATRGLSDEAGWERGWKKIVRRRNARVVDRGILAVRLLFVENE